RYPVAFRQHPDDFRMRMLLNLPDQRAPVRLGHPVLRLDLDVSVDAGLERALLGRHVGDVLDLIQARFDHLRVHRYLLSASATRPPPWSSSLPVHHTAALSHG